MLKKMSRFGFARATAGGGRVWLGVSLAIAALRFLRRLTGRKVDTVYCEKLRPGEQLVITHIPRQKP